MKTQSIIVALSFLSLLVLSGHNPKQDEIIKLSDLKFKSIFGYVDSSSTTIYSLLGTGFFRTPRSSDSDSLITTWIMNHPKAIVVPVSSFGPVEVQIPDSKMVYCWVIQDQDTLNNYLIRKGCFPGGTMTRPKTWSEMERWEKKLRKGPGGQMNVKVYIDKKPYDEFIDQIKAAEQYAQDQKLGIWKKEKE